MLCEKCEKNEATVRFVQIENDKKTELHLCQNCAQGHTSFTLGFDLPNILSNMFQQGTFTGKFGSPKEVKTCPTCGLNLTDVQKNGRLGCGTCHEIFREELGPVLRRLHGSVNHTGKVPAKKYPKVWVGRQIEEARKQLEECVRTENYEQAAFYRDEIRRLEKELGGEGSGHEGN